MITYSKPFLSFLEKSNGRIVKVLYHAYIKKMPAYQLMLTTNQANYIHFRKDGSISYLPAGRPLMVTPTGKWCIKGRLVGKPGKVIRKLFTSKGLLLFRDADFEYFCNLFKAWFCSDLKFYLQPNRLIPDIYNKKLASGCSSLCDSCMNGKGDYLDIYANCQHLRVLVLINTRGHLCGRALVWKIKREIVMDRIYVTQDYMYECFINYAIKHKWLYKSNYKSYTEKTWFVLPTGKLVERYFKIKTKTEFESHPYIDTFSFGSNGSLNNYGIGEHKYDCSTGERRSHDLIDDDDRYTDDDYSDEE